MKRYCLIIDDEPDTVLHENLIRNAQIKGFDIELISYNPNRSDLHKEENDEILIDFSKLTNDLDVILKRRIDVIACDFNLSDNKTSGLDLIKYARYKKRNARIFLFSGLIDSVVNDIIGDYDKTKNKKKLFENIKVLVKTGITDFVARENQQIEDAIIKNLKNPSWDEELTHVFNENKHIKFASGYPPFRGKTLEEIQQEIDNDTLKSQEFKNAILNLVVAQIINDNE